MILEWLTPSTENAEWNLALQKEKPVAPQTPEGKGAWPSAVASGLAGGARQPCMHTRCLPIICWPVSKKSEACSAQGTGERLFTRVYRNSCEAWVYSSVKYTCWLSYPNVTVPSGKEKEDGESVLTRFFTYIWLKRNEPIKQSWRNFSPITKCLSFSILT